MYRRPADILSKTEAPVAAGVTPRVSAGTGVWATTGAAGVTTGTTTRRTGETRGVAPTSYVVLGTDELCRGTHSIMSFINYGVS